VISADEMCRSDVANLDIGWNVKDRCRDVSAVVLEPPIIVSRRVINVPAIDAVAPDPEFAASRFFHAMTRSHDICQAAIGTGLDIDEERCSARYAHKLIRLFVALLDA
jgi:hypothetical protein